MLLVYLNFYPSRINISHPKDGCMGLGEAMNMRVHTVTLRVVVSGSFMAPVDTGLTLT